MEVCWELNWDVYEQDFWLFKPIEKTEFLLVSWRMSGSEFIRELIRENFPSTNNIRKWGKSHTILPNNYKRIFKKTQTKIIFTIADPRDVAAHIKTYENGIHFHTGDNFTDIENETLFLYENLKKIANLLSYYYNTFKDNIIILKYEDAINDRNKFLRRVSNFLKEKPLNVDNKQKYDSPIHKPIGIYHKHFKVNSINFHTKQNEIFYKKWKY
jgi:hypothetical protein